MPDTEARLAALEMAVDALMEDSPRVRDFLRRRLDEANAADTPQRIFPRLKGTLAKVAMDFARERLSD